MFTDLCARPNGRPCVNHSAFTYVRTEVHEGWHQNDAFGNVRRLTNNCVRNSTEASRLEVFSAPTFELAVDLVPPAVTLRTTRLKLHILDTEAQEHGLFRPLVYMPLTVILTFGNTQCTAIKRVERIFNRFTGFARGRRGDRIAGFPRGFDGSFELDVRHVASRC